MDRLTKHSTNIMFTDSDVMVEGMRLGTAAFESPGYYQHYVKIINKLAAYEDTGYSPLEIKSLEGEWNAMRKVVDSYRSAEEQGRLVILPVKAGDTVYQLRDKKHALGAGVHPRHISCVCVYGNDWFAEHQGDKPCTKKDFGKTWFLTREEAEAAMKGEREDV